MHWITVTKEYQKTPIAKHLLKIEDLLALPHTLLSQDPLCRLLRIDYQGKQYYCKYYRRSGKHVRRFLGLSRARREWVNLFYFHELGIPAPNIVAYGEQWHGCLYEQGLLITAALEDTMDLASMAQQQHPLLKNPCWRDKLIKLIAGYARQLHQNQFIHNDLKWRNILVKLRGEPAPYFIDCPCGKMKKSLLYKRGIIKDLACLDKKARYVLSRTQRLRFYLVYKQVNRLMPQHKKNIKKIVNFFAGRE